MDTKQDECHREVEELHERADWDRTMAESSVLLPDSVLSLVAMEPDYVRKDQERETVLSFVESVTIPEELTEEAIEVLSPTIVKVEEEPDIEGPLVPLSFPLFGQLSLSSTQDVLLALSPLRCSNSWM